MNVSSNVGMSIAGKNVSSGQYGADYASEYRRVIRQFIPDNATRFLEWGAGYTTKMLVEYIDELNAELFLTIDSNREYLNDVIRDINRPYLKAIAASMTGPCVDDRDVGLNYSHEPFVHGGKFDFIFIDGRRRMECALVAAILASQNAVIVIHDYRRNRYQTVHALFDVIEDGPQFRVLKVKPGIQKEMDDAFVRIQTGVTARP